MCAHRERSMDDDFQALHLPESERAQDSCILLPLYPGMNGRHIERIIEELRSVALRQMRRFGKEKL